MDGSKIDNKPSVPIPIPNDPTTIGVSVAMDALKQALSAGVEIARNREIGQTQRAAILAEKEVRIAQISGEIQRGMANDRQKHEQKMELIAIIKDLLVPNANTLTPEITSTAQMLLQILKDW